MEGGDTGSSDTKAGMVSPVWFLCLVFFEPCCSFLIIHRSLQLSLVFAMLSILNQAFPVSHLAGLTVADLVFPW